MSTWQIQRTEIPWQDDITSIELPDGHTPFHTLIHAGPSLTVNISVWSWAKDEDTAE